MGTEELYKKPRPMDEKADWVMSFVDDSREERQSLDDIWTETELNYLVRPAGDAPMGRQTAYPLAGGGFDCSYGNGTGFGHRRFGRPGYAVLKDPETHQEMMTIAAKIVLALFPPDDSFIKAVGVGFEDIYKGTTTQKLLEYAHRLPGQFWAKLQWVLSGCVFGTGIMEAFWYYSEAPQTFRSIEYDPLIDDEVSTSEIRVAPEYDDVRMEWRDNRDFFPDPGASTMQNMLGAACRFKLTAREANRRVDVGQYLEKPTLEAIRFRSENDAQEAQDKYGDETTGGDIKESHPDFMKLTGYRYVGEVPWKPEDGMIRRELVVLGGETVRDKVWPRRSPWFDLKLMPRFGSFWGLAPAEVIRYDQDFSDVSKMMMADAVVRMVHPSPLVNKMSGVRAGEFRNQRPDRPIMVDGSPRDVVAWPDYNPPLQAGLQVYAGTKQQMREASGALGAVQGLGLGSKRFSASEAVQTFDQAMDRPELFATVVEREYLPPLGKYTLKLYQEFIENTDELRKRVGESQHPVFLADIMPDYDVKFVGSRQMSNMQEADAFREVIAAGANPIAGQVIPWIPLLRRYFRKLGADEIAAMVGNEELIRLHMMLTQLSSPGGQNAQTGNGNGTQPSQPPLGALPAQVAGGIAQ